MQKDVTITYDINNTIVRLKEGKNLLLFSNIVQVFASNLLSGTKIFFTK